MQLGENDATLDACDHAWPGWRELPIVDKPERWLDRLEDDHEAVMPG